MNILLNLAPLKSGGGQNVALNFLNCILNDTYLHNFIIITSPESEIYFYLKKKNFKNIIIAPRNPIFRALFELVNGKTITKKHKIDIIYTYFGYGFYPKSIVQIIGSADSNIYYPEVNFWQDFKNIARLKKFLIDRYRMWCLNKATGIIYENEDMKFRAEKIYNLKNTIYIKPSIDENYSNSKFDIPINLKSNKNPICLLLCGWQKNKNYMIVPELASLLAQRNEKFIFLITAPKNKSKEHIEFENKCAQYSVLDSVHLIGNVSKNQLRSLYSQVDYVLLLSKLESFSNNIIESWFFEKTLIISDEQWSRSICQDAAIYVNRDSITDIANNLILLENNPIIKTAAIENGKTLRKTYPHIEDRTKQELDFLIKTYDKF